MDAYILINNDQTSIDEAEAQGYCGMNVSTDGSLIIMYHSDAHLDIDPLLTTKPSLPNYVVETIPNPQHMTKTQAQQIIAYEATSDGASDGWWFNLK